MLNMGLYTVGCFVPKIAQIRSHSWALGSKAGFTYIYIYIYGRLRTLRGAADLTRGNGRQYRFQLRLASGRG